MERLLIVEDEFFIATMTQGIAQSLGYEVVATAQNLQEAFLYLREGKFDVAAIDINLGQGLEGLEVGKELQSKGIPFFYITSHESIDIIREACKTGPETYLLKPISPPQLLAALEVSLQHSRRNEKPMLLLQDGTLCHQLCVDDILYVKSDNIYIDIHTHKAVLTLRMSLKCFQDMVPDGQFLQPHRSYLVNVANISKFSTSELWSGGHAIPIARSHKQSVLIKLKR